MYAVPLQMSGDPTMFMGGLQMQWGCPVSGIRGSIMYRYESYLDKRINSNLKMLLHFGGYMFNI